MDNKSIEIEYCTKCGWLPRSTWMAQEILFSFGDELTSVSLIPGEGGVFEVRSGNNVLWSRSKKGRFPEIKELKRIVRDFISPGKNLGHTDR